MARSTPRVSGAVLADRDRAASDIVVGSPAWFAWLEQASTFAFSSAEGRFTARKEQSGRAGWYWKAYRKQDGTLHRAYLGKSAELTLDRLNAIAADLAQRAGRAQPGEAAGVADPAQPDSEPPSSAAAQPTVTITFLFTDIEGSTRLWEQHHQAMHTALARHDAIVREAIQAWHGTVFKTGGDGFLTVFARATDALAAALAAQRGLRAEPWGATGPLRVRIALHSGPAEQRDNDYFGATVIRVARILDLGHGGQILLSRAIHDQVADQLPPQTTLRDLGEYDLKGLSHPEHVFQVVTPDLPATFPPLRAVDTQPARPLHVVPLLATKLHVPSIRPQFVPRPRLVERLQAGLMGKLTLISAPAGFGKTTLLSAWLSTKDEGGRMKDEVTQQALHPSALILHPFNVAWVSLDAEDNDPARFWGYVIAALETVYPAAGSGALALLRAPQLPPQDTIVTSLINAITPMTVDAALILDDYHLIATPAIHAAVMFLIDHLPPHLHLVMLTRADPPLPLTRLRMRSELTEVRAADLRFNAEETAAFLTVMMGLSLTDDQVAALEARTEGWVAGLQLAALAMRDRRDQSAFVAAFSGSNRFVVDYLVEEVLARLPAHLQTFVLQTAILDRLCGPLCDAILLGRTENQEPRTADNQVGSQFSVLGSEAYSQLILDQLERANMFLVALDDQRHWYRYHQLFAEVLRTRLRGGATAGEVATLYLRASGWCEQVGLIGEAVRYALLVQDVERAAILIERHAMTLLLTSNDVLQVRAWVEQVPRALIISRPQLALIAGFSMALAGQFAAVERLLADAGPAFDAPDLPPNVAGELAALRAMMARFQDDVAATQTHAQRALALLAHDNHRIRAGARLCQGVACMWRGELAAAKEALAEAAALGELGGSQWIALAALEELTSLQGRMGQLRQMLRTSEQAAQLSARLDAQQLPAAGMGYVANAEVLYEWNDPAGAAYVATQGIELLKGTVERLLLVRGYVVLARAYRAQGDAAAALESIDRCAAWFAQTPIAATDTARAWLAAHQARLWVAQGDLAAAAGWAQACTFAGESELGYVQQLTLVRLRLAQSWNTPGQLLIEARGVLVQLLAAVEARGWTHYQLEGLALQALICQAQADRAGALRTLQRALALAEPERYIRTFVDEGEPMAALLAQVAGGASTVAAYAATLLAAFPAGDKVRTASTPSVTPSPLHPFTPALVEPLSAREREILRLIADGHSNQAIADTLVVAVSTVKRHINNIYGKLDVQSRTQAIVRARGLNLL